MSGGEEKDLTLSSAASALFSGPNFAHVSTLLRDGASHVVPVWIDYGGANRVLFYKEDSSVASRNLNRDPRVAISVQNIDDPYEYVASRGHVIERRREPEAREWLRETAVKYTGRTYPDPMPVPGSLFVVVLERVFHQAIGGFVHSPGEDRAASADRS
jgi:PPOX class probable F420-dependent enzyme